MLDELPDITAASYATTVYHHYQAISWVLKAFLESELRIVDMLGRYPIIGLVYEEHLISKFSVFNSIWIIEMYLWLDRVRKNSAD